MSDANFKISWPTPSGRHSALCGGASCASSEMSDLGHNVPETLRLREGSAKEISGTVEVVYADAWDELAEAAELLAEALRVYGEDDEQARHALRVYDGD